MVILNVITTLSCLTYHSAKPCFHLPFPGLGGGGGGGGENFFFHFFLKNEERNVLGMEETRFKTDHSQHGKLGDYAFMLPKLILFVLSCRKKKKRSIRKEKRSIS